ncbi:MAG: ATPase, partial [Proteobacteria bacterium]
MSDTGWHTRSASQVLDDLGATPDGLGAAEAAHRLSAAGANVIPQKRGRSLAGMVVAQFADFMIVVLLAAALISGLIGEAADTIAILVIVVLNALVGATQEFRAERAVAALRQMSAPEARVVRDGGLVTIGAAELVPGDIVVLEAGNIVPADLRLVTGDELQVDESMLTGESEPVGKRDAVVETEDAVIGDRINMLFKSSLVTRGGGRGVVVATGAETEIGRIATLLSTSEG